MSQSHRMHKLQYDAKRLFHALGRPVIMRKQRIQFLALAVLSIASCTNFNDSTDIDDGADINDAFDVMSSRPEIATERCDNTRVVRQPPTTVSSSEGEDWTYMGFEWRECTPDVVYIAAGVFTITDVEHKADGRILMAMSGCFNVTRVVFNADGRIIDSADRVGADTDYDPEECLAWSDSLFIMPIDDFRTIATATNVKMRVLMRDEYAVSSFGPANADSFLNENFPPFLDKIAEIRGGLD